MMLINRSNSRHFLTCSAFTMYFNRNKCVTLVLTEWSSLAWQWHTQDCFSGGADQTNQDFFVSPGINCFEKRGGGVEGSPQRKMLGGTISPYVTVWGLTTLADTALQDYKNIQKKTSGV